MAKGSRTALGGEVRPRQRKGAADKHSEDQSQSAGSSYVPSTDIHQGNGEESFAVRLQMFGRLPVEASPAPVEARLPLPEYSGRSRRRASFPSRRLSRPGVNSGFAAPASGVCARIEPEPPGPTA